MAKAKEGRRPAGGATSPPASPGELRIEYVPLRDLREWPGNPKAHDLDAIGGSIARFGMVEPVVVDEGTGRLVAGHGRLAALAAAEEAGAQPPPGIKVDGGGWLAPVVRGVSFSSEAEAERFLVMANRSGELGGWDDHALARVLEELRGLGGLDETGYTDDEADAIIRAVAPPDPGGVEFPEFDEDHGDGVRLAKCPKCGHEFDAGAKK